MSSSLQIQFLSIFFLSDVSSIFSNNNDNNNMYDQGLKEKRKHPQ